MARLEVQGLSKAFRGVQALHDVSFTLQAGEVLALIGENGAGKSTLIRILSGAHPPDSGAVLLDGCPAAITGPAGAEALGIATVYQELSLFPELTVTENLLFNRYPGRGRIDWRGARREAAALLAELGLTVSPDQRVRELSVADKQMIEIAKALRRDARVLILDEPTAVLGGADVDRLLALVRGVTRRGVSVVFVSHRLDEVFGLADRYVVLKDGKLTGKGTIAGTAHDELVSKMVGRDFVRGSRTPGAEIGEPVLQVEGLSRPGVVSAVSFEVRAGEILGIAGLRGAGRTELARAIFGADPHTGTVRLHGKPVRITDPLQAIKAGIGLVPEERKTQGLVAGQSCAANISLVNLLKRGRRTVRPAADRSVARRYIEKLRIKTPGPQTPVGTLSGGNQQKVVLAKWLEAGVDLLILDEPTRGIDIGAKQEIYTLIRQLCAQGLAIIVISSELPEVLALSDRILVMHQGEVTAELPGRTATEEEIMLHAVGGR
ncbi:sugar ABC transporter ATP-binding protein [Amycolatopsis sp. FU40]|uniref:sugar ABC transporter ATP-binding protein n=1 Tax=Amycolatopsis sp. FU40 TaxID=2914159 RepID=UPI001F203A3D|nr:sugar ABC transporter ATP-binding protein [Amycolatopsis sp. FU40]UKD57036.1 sugar ABC transporter ATP-binding protein [Amycolatopsis sp. FU40]